ncbi:hypothetical protein SAMN04487948_107109 [Halogranum amylolyticum]|uniref:DUF7282 domain-containing protein n=1 Tax=Halogranum amylolyticum TaxID=660520 RepID=A0A1H8TJE2_9EURY|nr:hypothetical protein [Halogranum amylolyticum]SEO91082.1 hypothetical protein SAMN04487948_107109 [Halogranum amylolyticum]
MRRRDVIGGLFVLGTGGTDWVDTPPGGGAESGEGPEEARTISGGTTVEGTLGDGEELWYTVDLEKAETVSVVFRVCEDWTERRAAISVCAPDGTVLDSTEVPESDYPRVAIGGTVPETGTYAVRVASLEGQLPYSVLIDVADDDGNEPNDDRESATAIVPSEPVDGVVVGAESDWYVFDAEAGDGIELELTAHDLADNRDVEMALFDPTGDEIGETPRDRPFGAYSTVANFVDCTDLETAIGADVAERNGSYFVRVQGVDGSVRGFTDYTLVVETVDLGRDEPNEHRSTATPLTPDETIETTLAGYDHDWYRFDADEGDEITVDYEVTEFVDLFSREMTLYDPHHDVVDVEWPTTTAETTGSYSLHVAQSDEMGPKPFLEKEGYALTVSVDDGDSSETARVTFADQRSDGGCVIVDEVTLPEGGFVVLYDERPFTGDDGVLPNVRGVSSFLEAGSHERVEIGLDEPLAESRRLWAAVYHDSNGNREFDLVTTADRDKEWRYTTDEIQVMDDARVERR